MASTHTFTVAPSPASGPGALDGHEAVCACGFRMGTSLGEREAKRLGWEHADFMARKEARA